MTVDRVQFQIRKTAQGYEGMLVLPTTLQEIARATLATAQAHPQAQMVKAQLAPMLAKSTPLAVKSAPAPSSADSIEQAAALAEKVLDNPIVRDLLPPGTNSAIAAAKTAAELIKSGKAQEALSKAGSAVSSVAKGIASLF